MGILHRMHSEHDSDRFCASGGFTPQSENSVRRLLEPHEGQHGDDRQHDGEGDHELSHACISSMRAAAGQPRMENNPPAT